MILTTTQRSTVESIVAIFETGQIPSTHAYSTVTVLADGAGISYGLHQATARSGSLVSVLREFYALGGTLGDWSLDAATSAVLLSVDRAPLPLPPKVAEAMGRLREAGADSRMRQAQDAVFERLYWAPALRQAADLRLVLPLSMLALYDLAIHSGLGRLAALRPTFPEVPPVRGGDERLWTSALIETRHRWLLASSREVIRRTAYRTQALRDLVAADRWTLERPLTVRGVVIR